MSKYLHLTAHDTVNQFVDAYNDPQFPRENFVSTIRNMQEDGHQKVIYSQRMGENKPSQISTRFTLGASILGVAAL